MVLSHLPYLVVETLFRFFHVDHILVFSRSPIFSSKDKLEICQGRFLLGYTCLTSFNLEKGTLGDKMPFSMSNFAHNKQKLPNDKEIQPHATCDIISCG